MASLLDLLKKGGNAIKDAFVYTDEERQQGKAPNLLEKIPMRASDTRDNIESFFAPSPDKVRVRDVARELPSNAGEMLKDILQGTARSFDFVGRKLTPWEENIGQKTGFNKKIDDILFGGADKRSNSLTDVGETELGLDREKHPILTPLAGLGIIGLDFVPGGQGKSKGIKQFISSLTDDVAETLAKSSDRDLIESTVRQSAAALTDNEVVKLVDDLLPTKSVNDVKSVVTGVPVKDAGKSPITQFIETGEPIKNSDEIVVWHNIGKNPTQEKGTFTSVRPSLSTLGGDTTERIVIRPNKTKTTTNSADLYQELFPNAPKRDVEVFDFDNIDTAISRELRKQGYDSVRYTNPLGAGVPEYVILDNKIITGRKGVGTRSDAINAYQKELENLVGKKGADSAVDDSIEMTTSLKSAKQQEIDQAMLERDFIEESVQSNPARELIRYMGKGDNSLAEMQYRGESQGLKGAGLDDKVTELGFRDMDEAQQALEQYSRDKERLENAKQAVRDLKLEYSTLLKDESGIKMAKETIVDGVPEGYQKPVAKALDGAEAETKKLSPRRLADAKKYGISEDVMGRMLHAKAGGRMTHEEASELSSSINAPMKDLLTKPANTFQLSRPKIEAYSQELQGYFENVVKKLKAHSGAFPDDRDLVQQYQEASRTYMKARTTLEAVISEAGRVVEGAKVIGRYSRLPGMDGKIKKVREQIVKFAERNPKHADLPTEFDMALETVDLNNTTQTLDFLTQWNRASFLQKLSEFQKASLLSALSTHAVNALGNAIQQVIDIPVRALAGGLDAGKSAITGSERTVYAGESLAQVRGAFRSAPASIERAIKALGNEHYAQELRRTEIEAGTVVPAIRGRFGKVVRLPFRLLQMADLGFRTVKQGAESEALATRIAKMEGLKGKAYKERVNELKDNLPQDMLDLVDERVERSLMLEDLDGMLKSVEDLKNKYPIMQFVIPFYRTLVNLSREAYRMTPIGGIGRTVGRITPGQTGRNIERAFQNKWTQNENTKMEELSRQIIGTSIMAWVVTNMLNGDVEITGPAPSNAGDREVFYGQGKLPHSIRYGDTWVEFQRVQPIGQLLQVGASISEAIEAYRNTGQLTSADVEKEVANSIGDIGSMVFTQSPFTGVSDLFSLLKGGEYKEGYFQAGNRYIGQMAGTFIPNILRRLTVAQDPIVYEKRDIESQLKSRIPGLAQTLTPRRDVFGETVRQGGTFESRFASPIRTSESIENKLYDEMADIEFSPTVANREAFNEELSVKEYDMLKRFYGPRFRDEMWSIVNDEAYKTLTPEQKRDALSKVSRKVMDMARQTLFPVYMEKDQLRKQWQAEGYKPMVIEDALKLQFPYDKETLEIYAETLLDQSIQQGEARQTIEELLK